METLKVDIQNNQEKKVLLAFLDSLNYQYKIENNDYVTDEQLSELDQRRADMLAGKASSLPWSEAL
ncbi:addiction module protein [Mucilaginibacter sabulilitoris]|uniref:Addiction module protein n=1 Tax=Mucilaginibacter sabulilitoris TaxID=1173583 RepID=A0ABZ0TIG4_9SPHI|nr:addiction module protein [Mucilaginibacter sabulilitoris]WPU92596.1 addiction module protein [Mucilaginibacter sabulilitoris]